MTSFTSFAPRNLTPAERQLILRLELRRRQNHGQVFALIADPHHRLRRICSIYLAWLQRFVYPDSNAAIGLPSTASTTVPRQSISSINRFLGSEPIKPYRNFTEQYRREYRVRRSDLYAIPRAYFFGARNPNQLRGVTINQLLIDQAHIPLRSKPYRNGLFSRLPAAAFPSLTLWGPHVCLILGDPHDKRHNHFRRYWLNRARDNPDCLILDPEAELAAQRARRLAIRLAAARARPPHRILLLPKRPPRPQQFVFGCLQPPPPVTYAQAPKRAAAA